MSNLLLLSKVFGKWFQLTVLMISSSHDSELIITQKQLLLNSYY